MNVIKKRELCKQSRNVEKAKQKTQQEFDHLLLESLNQSPHKTVPSSNGSVKETMRDLKKESKKPTKIESSCTPAPHEKAIPLNKPDEKSCLLCDACSALPGIVCVFKDDSST